MRSMAGITIALLMMFTLAAASQPSAKLRRDGVLNLYPFPRVGRSYWRVPLEDLLDQKPKKSSLYAFPRVGRNDEVLRNKILYQMRSEPSYLRLEPGGYHQLPNLNTIRDELTQLNHEPAQLNHETTKFNPELKQFYPEPTHNSPELAQKYPDSTQILFNYQNPSGMSQNRPNLPQNRPDLDLVRRELYDLLENIIGKVKNRHSKRESESTDSTGMWFGPRLGRSDKSIDYEDSSERKNINPISPAMTGNEQNGERVKRNI